jgi:malic enzyme
MLGLTSDAFTQFVDVGQAGVGPLRVIVSRGLNAGEIIVGDSEGLLVAETPGAPVELRVVEPAIGGVEVGIIGAFEAVVVDNGAFALITTAS